MRALEGWKTYATGSVMILYGVAKLGLTAVGATDLEGLPGDPVEMIGVGFGLIFLRHGVNTRA